MRDTTLSVEDIERFGDLFLQKVKLGLTDKVSPETIEAFLRSDLNSGSLFDVDQYVLRIRLLLDSSKTHVETFSEHQEIPDGLWQHFRQRWLPKFWLRLFPLRMRRIERKLEINLYRVCPHLNMARDFRGAHLTFLSGGELDS